MKNKHFFSSPKKIIAFSGGAILALGILGTVSFFSAYAIAENASIGKDSAVNNAYSAAGISANDVDAVDAKLKLKNGKFVYEIEFYSNGQEYEYDIHSKNGSVLEFEHPDYENPISTAITVDEAKSNVIAHAGVKSEEVTFTKVKLEKDDGIFKYEIEFRTDKKKYEYEISAKDGKILKSETEIILFSKPSDNINKSDSIEEPKNKVFPDVNISNDSINNSSDEKSEITSKNEKAFITEEEALEIAFKDAGIDDFKGERFIEKEKDDNKTIFEIEFSTNSKYFKYEIDANTGKIHEKEVSFINSSSQFEDTIGIEQGKKIALENLSIKSEDVIFTKAKLEKDEKNLEYEIEFLYNNVKYEFSINAVTGEIIEVEID